MPRSCVQMLAPLLVATLSTGCENSFNPTTGELEVVVVTVGEVFGPDRYLVSTGSGASQHVAINGSVIFTGLMPGTTMLQLGGVPTSCLVSGGPDPRAVTISAGRTTKVVFRISCGAVGSVQVTVRTTGPDPDPDGYRVTVTGADGRHLQSSKIDTNATLTLVGVEAGKHVVMLLDVASNCDSRDLLPRVVTLAVRGTAEVSFQVECAPVGRLAYVVQSASGSGDIYAINANGTGATNLTQHPASDQHPAWSPDGRSIAFTSDRHGRADLFVMKADGCREVTRLTTDGGTHPAWSPDGRRIAFSSDRDGSWELYSMNADGSDQVRLTDNDAMDSQPAWSPDGRRIAFVSDRDANPEVYVMNADGSNPVALTNDPARDTDPAWSPDGRKLAFTRLACSRYYQGECEYVVVVLSVNSPAESRELAGSYEPAWSPDGRHIAFTGYACNWWDDGDVPCFSTGIALVRADGTNHINFALLGSSQPAWQPTPYRWSGGHWDYC